MKKLFKATLREGIRFGAFAFLLFGMIAVASTTISNTKSDSMPFSSEVLTADHLNQMKVHWDNIIGAPSSFGSDFSSVGGGTILWEKEYTFSSDSSQGDSSNPRYVSDNVRDIITEHCNVGTGQANRCFIEGYMFRTTEGEGDGGFINGNRLIGLSYLPTGFMGLKNDFVSQFSGKTPDNNIRLSDGRKHSGGCGWRGDGATWTLCEHEAAPDGTWDGGEAPDDLFVSVDRQRHESVKLYVRIINVGGASELQGSYCVLMNGGSCPAGFTEGTGQTVIGHHAHNVCPTNEGLGDSEFLNTNGVGTCTITMKFCCK